MLNRFDEVPSHSEGVVYDQRNTVIMGDLKVGILMTGYSSPKN